MTENWPFPWIYMKDDGKQMILEEYEAYVRNYIRENPDDMEGRFHMILLCWKLNWDNELIEQLEAVRTKQGNPENEAKFWVYYGSRMEKQCDYESAAYAYKHGVFLKPKDKFVWYFANNNLGYSLVQLQKYKEAEKYCRKAIKIDKHRHNAHKNLGLSLCGQGKFIKAVDCFVTSTMACPQDPRAFKHLEDLMKHHPELANKINDINEIMTKCRLAVNKAQEEMKKEKKEDKA